MDLQTFYAVISATCFTLVGLWWKVVADRPDWTSDVHLKRLAGSVYLSFLLPALMGLAPMIDPSNPLIWRVTFFSASAIGVWSTYNLIRADRQVRLPGTLHRHRWLVLVVYLLIAVLGAVPELARLVGLKPLQSAGVMLVLLVAMAHALTWEFMTHPAPDSQGTRVKDLL